MDLIVPLLVHGVPLAAIFGITTWTVYHDNPRRVSQRDHYRSAYGPFLERVFVESPVERAKVLQVRDPLKSGEMAAVRYVIKWDPIPLGIAIQFVRTL